MEQHLPCSLGYSHVSNNDKTDSCVFGDTLSLMTTVCSGSLHYDGNRGVCYEECPEGYVYSTSGTSPQCVYIGTANDPTYESMCLSGQTLQHSMYGDYCVSNVSIVQYPPITPKHTKARCPNDQTPFPGGLCYKQCPSSTNVSDSVAPSCFVTQGSSYAASFPPLPCAQGYVQHENKCVLDLSTPLLCPSPMLYDSKNDYCYLNCSNGYTYSPDSLMCVFTGSSDQKWLMYDPNPTCPTGSSLNVVDSKTKYCVPNASIDSNPNYYATFLKPVCPRGNCNIQCPQDSNESAPWCYMKYGYSYVPSSH